MHVEFLLSLGLINLLLKVEDLLIVLICLFRILILCFLKVLIQFLDLLVELLLIVSQPIELPLGVQTCLDVSLELSV